MRLWVNAAIYVVCFAGTLSSWAQEGPLEDAPVATTKARALVEGTTAGYRVGVAPGFGASENTNVQFTNLAKHQIASGSYLWLNGLSAGLAVFDVEMTQRCTANYKCREANPRMPSPQAGQLSVNFALVAYPGFWSYRLKKRNSKIWWFFPMSGAVVHSVGVATGFEHQ